MPHSEAYWEGYQAYQDDLSVYDNPYEAHGDQELQWEEWIEGYYAAAWDD